MNKWINVIMPYLNAASFSWTTKSKKRAKAAIFVPDKSLSIQKSDSKYDSQIDFLNRKHIIVLAVANDKTHLAPNGSF